MQDLREFIKCLEKKGLLKRISEEVSSQLEITEISRRVLEQGGAALLFENVIKEDGSKSEFPVLANLFGTKGRVALGLGKKDVSEIRELGEMLAFLRQPEPPKSAKDAFDVISMGYKTITKMKPKAVSKAPCQQIILKGEDVDLSQFPIQKCWPEDVSSLITWPLIVTKGADSRNPEDSYNLGIYRMQPIAKNKTIVRWLKHRGGAQHFERWKKMNSEEKFPLAAVIGADSGVTLSAVTPIPDTLSEYEFAGLLRNEPVELVKCKTIPLKVPANAEIVLEGFVSFEEYAEEGPFGDHTGFYNSVERFPVFEITAITMRKDAIYHSTYTGHPPDECSVLGESMNEMFIPLLQQQFPEIVDFWLPPEGCSYRVAVVSIKKAYAGHAKRVMMAVWSYLRQFMYTKFVIVVDEDINCRDWNSVIWAMSVNMDPARDTTIIEHTPIDYLDFASVEDGLGSKIGFDATTKIGSETKREWGKKIEMSQDVIDKVTKNWKKYGI